MARTAVVAGTATAVSNRVARRQYNRWEAQEAQAQQQQSWDAPPPAQPVYVAAPPPPPPAPAEPGDSTTEQLERLAQLRAQGILSEEEFAAAKAKLLGL
jgi:hypothetical protein